MKKNNAFMKKLALLAIGLFVCTMMIAPASATAVSIGYGVENQNTTIGGLGKLHPSTTAIFSAIGETFNATSTFYLETATFYMRRADDPEFHIKAALWGVTDSSPNATMLANSTNYQEAELITTDVNGQSISFNFDGSYQLTFNQSYAIGVFVSDMTAETGEVRIGADSTDPTFTAGAYQGYFSSGWNTQGIDIIFVLTGETVAGFYVPDPTTGWWSEQGLADFMGFIVPLLVVLLPAILLIVVAKRPDKWLILIGITIGAGLGYYFGMVPLWLVFLVVIGLIGLAYQSVRGGG